MTPRLIATNYCRGGVQLLLTVCAESGYLLSYWIEPLKSVEVDRSEEKWREGRANQYSTTNARRFNLTFPFLWGKMQQQLSFCSCWKVLAFTAPAGRSCSRSRRVSMPTPPVPTLSSCAALKMSSLPDAVQIKRPVILFDVMGTIVHDPFHDRMPAFFGFTFKELLAAKHPTAWIEFEKGLLSEEEFAAKFFEDGREYDYDGLKLCMAGGYEYLDGMAILLQRLKAVGIQMHAFSNYPTWYTMIEDKLKLSQYLPWTFVSCHSGLRKPDHQAYLDAAQHLGVQPSECIFVDDQLRNIEAAAKLGMVGIQFQNAEILEKELAAHGINLQPPVPSVANVMEGQT